MYVYISACVRVKWVESERFRIDSGIRQGYIIFPSLFNVYIVDAVMKMGMGRKGRFSVW